MTANKATATAEKSQEVVISPEDVRSAAEFWKHFNIPMTDGLKSAFDTFCATPTFANQETVKLEITKAIATTDHAAFKDEMFSTIREECEAVSFEMAFERDLEKTLSEDK